MRDQSHRQGQPPRAGTRPPGMTPWDTGQMLQGALWMKGAKAWGLGHVLPWGAGAAPALSPALCGGSLELAM